MKAFTKFAFPLGWLLTALIFAPSLSAQPINVAWVKNQYQKYEYEIPMRDGVKLFTIVYVPKDASENQLYPVVLNRTCYSIAPYGPNNYTTKPGPSDTMTREKYIFVNQDVRGRYKSEGVWENVRPFNPHKKGSETDEASDTFDTIDWIIKNVPHNNGKVGQWGISYPGFYTTMGALSGHPALVAASPQAPVTDFYFEDFHHNGALTQGYFYTYPLFGIQTGGPTEKHWWLSSMVQEGVPDDYAFQLALGPLKNTTERYYKNNEFWNQIINHPNYDAFWQARGVKQHLKNIKPAMMTVGGWFDAEDLYGPLTVYKTIEKNNPNTYNTLVMGPFAHGQWNWDTQKHTLHGDHYFGDSLAVFYQKNMEAPFFKHFLKGTGDGKTGLPDAYLFDTGRHSWEKFDQWPQPSAKKVRFFLDETGKLAEKNPAQKTASSFISDPQKPVPSRCLVPTIEGLTMMQYMSDDQRCFSTRSDVLTFKSEILEEDVTLGGEILAHLNIATTGTDADFVVKLIDVFPPNAKNHAHMPNKNIHLAGYQMMVRSEIMRGRYRKGFDKPQPIPPNKETLIQFPLQDVLHTFKKGHRIMIQVQSTMFPLFDRNPQKYVPNIYFADEKDFIRATHKVFNNSYIEVQVLNQKP